jgi:hypothetical protein
VKKLNRKSLVIAFVLLSAILLVSPLIGTVAACRARDKENYACYKSDWILGRDIVTHDEVVNGIEIVDGTRDPLGIFKAAVTINDKEYSYPKDFSYIDTWHLELDLTTYSGPLTAKCVLTFNLPGKPTITESLTTKIQYLSPTEAVYQGGFTLTGTKMFSKVEGRGIESAYNALYNGENALYATHMGIIKNWPFEESGRCPQKITYSYGEILVPDPAHPGVVTINNNIMYSKGGGHLAYLARIPFAGPEGTVQGSSTGSLRMDLVSYTGYGQFRFVDNGPVGTVVGTGTLRLTGIGLYTYDGPTFTAAGITVANGEQAMGVLMESNWIAYGTGQLKGLVVQGSFTGISFSDGSGYDSGTATYMFMG